MCEKEEDKERYLPSEDTEYTNVTKKQCPNPEAGAGVGGGPSHRVPSMGAQLQRQFLVSWCHTGISPRAIKQHLPAKQSTLSWKDQNTTTRTQPACCSGTEGWGEVEQRWRRWGKSFEHKTHKHNDTRTRTRRPPALFQRTQLCLNERFAASNRRKAEVMALPVSPAESLCSSVGVGVCVCVCVSLFFYEHRGNSPDNKTTMWMEQPVNPTFSLSFFITGAQHVGVCSSPGS